MAPTEAQLKEMFQKLLKKNRPQIRKPLLNGASGLNEIEIIWSRGDRQRIPIGQNQAISERANKFR